MKTIHLKKRNIEWARQFLESGMITTFAYLMKRNKEFNVDSMVLDMEEQYAILRQSMSKHDIERMFNIKIIID